MEPAGRYALEPLEEVAERTLRFSILWTVSRSYPVSLPWVLGTALAAPFPPFPDMWIGNTYLDDSGRDSPASLNSTGDM